MTQQLTEKSDVYSFGVVMLELITARPPIFKGRYIVREVKEAINENDDVYFGLKDIMDVHICDARYLVGFRRFVELALQCIQDSSVDRPAMSYIVKEIEKILQDDGINISSAYPSARDFGVTKAAPQHDYSDSTQGTNTTSNSFGTFLSSSTITPTTR